MDAVGDAFEACPYCEPDPQVVPRARLLPVGSQISMDGVTRTASHRSGADLVRCLDNGRSTLAISKKRASLSPAA